MSKLWKKDNFWICLVITFSLILFLPGLFVYFHQDDFIHMGHSQNIGQVISAFNIFQKGEFPFYRPIPTQLYFYFSKLLFGLDPLGYHLINLGLFAFNTLLVYKLIKKLSDTKWIAIISSLIFSVNSTHFAPLNSPAYVHELFYVMFGVLTVNYFLDWIIAKNKKNYITSITLFLFALMSKETAVVLPLILVLITLFLSKKNARKKTLIFVIPYFSLLIIYLYAHIFYYGLAVSPSYKFIIGIPNLNIFFWYFLWALSTPNILIDFFGPGIKISSVFFDVSKISGWIYFVFFPVLMVLGIINLSKSIFGFYSPDKIKFVKLVLFGLLWFGVGLIPLVVYPLHKLATQQAFSLVGLSMSLSTLLYLSSKTGLTGKIISFSFIWVYLVVAVNSVILAGKTHWIITSARQAKNVINFFIKRYPDLKENSIVYFQNGTVAIPEYGSSRQLYQALGNGIGLKIILNKPDLKLYFEDINPLPSDTEDKSEPVLINSSDFLGY